MTGYAAYGFLFKRKKKGALEGKSDGTPSLYWVVGSRCRVLVYLHEEFGRGLKNIKFVVFFNVYYYYYEKNP